jgi:hypothetical protein
MALGVSLCSTGCGGAAAAPRQEHSEAALADGRVLPEASLLETNDDAQPDALAAQSFDPEGQALIGACSYRCLDGCSHPGIVVGWRLDSHEQFVPVGLSAEQAIVSGGYGCGARLPIGERVALEARVERGFAFLEWLTGVNPEFNWQRCPCAGSQDRHCQFTVQERVYCGAVYREEAL